MLCGIELLSMSPVQVERSQNLLDAQMVQQGLLPKERHFRRLFSDSFVTYLPKDVLSGDFYWIGRKHNLRYLVVGDCTGHGVSASLTTVLALSLFEYIIMNKGVKRTDKILNELHDRYLECFRNSNDTRQIPWIELSIVCINDESGKVYFSSAGRRLLYVDATGKMQVFHAAGFPIGGKHDEEMKFETISFPFCSGDRIYMGSDGYQHQFGGPRDKKFGTGNLHALLQSNVQLPFAEQQLEVERAHYAWKGGEDQTDDICIVGVEL